MLEVHNLSIIGNWVCMVSFAKRFALPWLPTLRHVQCIAVDDTIALLIQATTTRWVSGESTMDASLHTGLQSELYLLLG